MVNTLRSTYWRYTDLFEQSFYVGWTNIAGWLAVVTTQAFFAGSTTDINRPLFAYLLANSSTDRCSSRCCVKWNICA